MLYTPAVIEPQGERRSAWWVIAEIMRRLGVPVPDYVPETDLQEGADEAMLAALMPAARTRFEAVATQGPVVLPMEFPGRGVAPPVDRLGGWQRAQPARAAIWPPLRAQGESAHR